MAEAPIVTAAEHICRPCVPYYESGWWRVFGVDGSFGLVVVGEGIDFCFGRFDLGW